MQWRSQKPTLTDMVAVASPSDTSVSTIPLSEHERIVASLDARYAQQVSELRKQQRRQILLLRRQVAQEQQAFLDPVNRHGTRTELGVDDQYLYEHPQVLLEHYIMHGGAEAFAQAYKLGMVVEHVRRRKKRKRKRVEPEYYI
jgi:hypothetical protein